MSLAPNTTEEHPVTPMTWYYRKWVVIVALAIPVVGLILLWKSPAFKTKERIAWSLVAAFMALMWIGGLSDTETPDMEESYSASSRSASTAVTEWNTKELDAIENGNIETAVELLKTISVGQLTSSAEQFPAAKVMKAPWKYYGKVLEMTGEVAVAQEYPPGSDEARLFGGSVSEITLITSDESIVTFIQLGDTGDVDVGDRASVYGYVTGITEVENAVGGTLDHLFMVGKVVTEL